MKTDFEKIKEYTNNTSLTQEEKFSMFQNIRTYTDSHPIRTPIYSPFMKYSLAYASMFAIIIATSATSFAAEQALPGDMLYTVKTNVNEKVIQTFALSDESKAQVTVNLMNRRLEELEQMIIKNTDTPEKIDIIIDKLEEHKDDLAQIQSEQDSSELANSRPTYVALESSIDAHLDILEHITQTSSNTKEEVEPTVTLAKNTSEGTSNTPNPALVALKSIETVSTSSDSDINENATSTKKKQSKEDSDETVEQIVKFSEEIDPIIDFSKDKASEKNQNTAEEEIKNTIKKQILEKAEQNLNIDINL